MIADRARTAARWIARRTSAAVAVALIALALVVGYQLGAPSESRDAEPAAETATDPDAPAQMYTCSMHPSVRLPDPDAKCPICFMDLIPVDEGEGAGDPGAERRITLSPAAVALAEIQTTEAERFAPTARVRLYGELTEDQTRVARLTAYFPGRLERLFTNYVGVPVNRGEHVAEVYSPDLLAAFEELRQAARAAGQASGDYVRETARQTLRAARERLRLLGLTDEQVRRAEQGELDADAFTIYAPIGGVVTHLAVREGDYVDTGEPIATVADLSRLWLEMEAYETDLPLLRWGQPVTFSVKARPGETFSGRVSFIEPMVDAATRTATVRVAIDNADRRLKPGMYATATAEARLTASGVAPTDEFAGAWVCPMHPEVVEPEQGDCAICGMDLVTAETLAPVGDPADAEPPLVIPATAPLITGTRAVVYVEVPGAERPTYEGREVVLGARAGDVYIVKEGLRAGERVVTRGAFKIDSAMQIAAKPSMMSPDRAHESGDAHDHDGARAGPEVYFVYRLAPVLSAYLDAQEALADDDLDAYLTAADALGDAVESVSTAGVLGEDLETWRSAARDLRPGERPADIAAARDRFETQSTGAIALVRAFGNPAESPLRLTHCPMAFDFAGADWLQRAEVVDNPYFGDQMLRCGEIRETFDPAPAQEGGR